MSDYTIDWSHTNVDGNNTIAGPDGDIHVKIATPENAQGDEWFVENGMLKNWDVTTNSSADITFSEEVADIKFTLLDVDAIDKITIMTKDADGNAVEVQFEATGVHAVTGNMVTGTQTNAPGPSAENSGQDIDITIPGPLKSFWIVLDDGTDRNFSGTVAVSDIHFDIANTGDGYVEGGAGDDTIDVDYIGDPDGDMIDNNDEILPGEGPQDDIVLAGGGDDFVIAGDGDDEIYGGEGDDTLCGNDGDDVIYAGAGNDILEGMNNNDVLIGGQGNDIIYGDAGNDVMSGGVGDDKMYGGSGEDFASGGKGADFINMGSGNDVAYGGVGGDSILGGDGDDTLFGGNMSYDGTQDFNDLSTGELVDGQYIAEGVTITSADPRTPVMAFDTANPTGGDNDLATANLGKVLILSEDRDGSDPDDNASGGTFNITFENPASVTSLTLLDVEEGAWVKYYDMDGNLLQQVDVSTANNGQHVVTTDLHNVASIKVILAGSGAIDNLSYSIDPDNMDGDDVINGGIGEDYIEGNAGNDSIDGGKDDDELYGGAGDDRIFGNDGDDIQYGGIGNDNLGGADRGNDIYYGGDGNDMVEASYGDDTLYGDEGDDNLWASADNDLVFGGEGNDSAYGGHGQDVVYGDAGDDTLSGGSDADTVYGGAGDDLIDGDKLYKDDTGAVGDDVLFGGADADTIIANAGDTVFGGADGDDYDTLDLTGQGPFYLDNVVSDTTTGGNGNGINGTVVFVDGGGVPTGETLTFTDIENVIGDEVNRAPVAGDDTATVDEDGSVDIIVLTNDSDPDGDDLDVVTATSPNGEVTINPDNTLTFVPADNFNGETSITYTVDDGNGGQATATVTVTVTPVNDDPDAVDDSDTTAFNTAITVDLLDNDTDVDIPEGDVLTVTAASVPASQGSLVDNGDGTVTFTPATGFTGDATISYTIEDTAGASDSAVHVITVDAGLLDGTVEGTAGDDLIDVDYLGDPEGDLIDNNDAIVGNAGSNDDIVEAYGGNDIIYSGDGDDTVFGGSGNDMVFSGVGNDTLYGEDGNDKLEGSGGEDKLYGGEGDDDLWGGANNDLIIGGAGNDSANGGGGDDIIRGGAGNDVLEGHNNNDMLFGGRGDDSLFGGSGDDKIEGGSGNDVIEGGLGNDDLWGASGDDSVYGGRGNDTIMTAEGKDYVEGGDGNDIIDTGNDENPFTTDPGQNLPDQGYPGQYTADLDPNDDLDTVFGGAGSDTISTGDDDDTIYGGTGNDQIDAGIDDDYVEGGDGDDTIIGSEGNDEIYGGEDDDTIYGGLTPGGLGDAFNLPDDIDGDGDSNDPGEDLVTDNNNDTLFGGAGNDTIFGADDDDTLFGGIGDDVLDGGVDDDTLYGDEGNDAITGGQGNDDQFGGTGSDVFLGGNGGDVVTGGEDADGSDVDVLDLTGSGVETITYVAGDPEAGTVTFLDGSTMTFSEIENVVPCFTPGTTIATPKGERLVEDLQEGDRIITRDNGIQEIRWVGRKEMSGKALVANPHLKPILVRAGSLGNGLPERDMLVSPNHRMLVASEKTQLYFEEREVLAAAKHLVGSEGIHAVDVMGTAYIHFMFDRHEVVLSNGAWTESFQPGDYTLKGIGNAQRNEIFELFPELSSKVGLAGYQSARRALKKHEAALLAK